MALLGELGRQPAGRLPCLEHKPSSRCEVGTNLWELHSCSVLVTQKEAALKRCAHPAPHYKLLPVLVSAARKPFCQSSRVFSVLRSSAFAPRGITYVRYKRTGSIKQTE